MATQSTSRKYGQLVHCYRPIFAFSFASVPEAPALSAPASFLASVFTAPEEPPSLVCSPTPSSAAASSPSATFGFNFWAIFLSLSISSSSNYPPPPRPATSSVGSSFFLGIFKFRYVFIRDVAERTITDQQVVMIRGQVRQSHHSSNRRRKRI